MTPVSVLIADDHELFAETLGLTLDLDDRMDVVGSARNGQEALQLAEALEPDVVLMDLEMPVLDGIEATRVLGLAMPGCRVVVLTASPSPEDLVRAKNAGAAGYLTKGCSAEDVVAAVVDAVEDRHLEVHEHDVRLERVGQLQRLLAVTGGADDVHAVVEVERQAEGLGEELVVVCDEHGNGGHRGRLLGGDIP